MQYVEHERGALTPPAGDNKLSHYKSEPKKSENFICKFISRVSIIENLCSKYYKIARQLRW